MRAIIITLTPHSSSPTNPWVTGVFRGSRGGSTKGCFKGSLHSEHPFDMPIVTLREHKNLEDEMAANKTSTSLIIGLPIHTDYRVRRKLAGQNPFNPSTTAYFPFS